MKRIYSSPMACLTVSLLNECFKVISFGWLQVKISYVFVKSHNTGNISLFMQEIGRFETRNFLYSTASLFVPAALLFSVITGISNNLPDGLQLISQFLTAVMACRPLAGLDIC
jgi:hypothetical protein